MDTWIHKLYQDCAADLFRIARYRLQDEQLAQDIVQEVFLLLLERKKELKRHPNQKGWLIKAMDYRILHALEKQGRELPLLEVYPSPDGDHSQSLDALLPTQLSPEETQLLKLFYEEHLSKTNRTILKISLVLFCMQKAFHRQPFCIRWYEKTGALF